MAMQVTTTNTTGSYGNIGGTYPSPYIDGTYPSPYIDSTIPTWTYSPPPLNYITSFGGKVKSMRDLPEHSTIGVSYFVEDLNGLVVREWNGWFMFDLDDQNSLWSPSDKSNKSQEKPKELVQSKDITRWPPRD